ncbi:MAG TPA: pantetheine-phosphate adenylyltransferase [Bacteroidota bacterium]|nr:pantetheine-phosphate adenylyltransferase [Bacteroidota bacterium]
MKVALYPGTFDPITNGHIDILERGMELFDRVIVTVAKNSTKSPIFDEEERVAMIREIVKEKKYRKVTVESFDGLLIDFARAKHAVALIRGLRAISDFEYEFQMALINRKQEERIHTVFLMPHEKYTYLNSSIVRELARLHGEFRAFVPPNVYRRLKEKMGRR